MTPTDTAPAREETLRTALQLHDDLARLDEKSGDTDLWTDNYRGAIEATRTALTLLATPAPMQAPTHVLYETKDADAPDSIRDSNGDVALGLCRVCGRGEVELEEPCAPRPAPMQGEEARGLNETALDALAGQIVDAVKQFSGLDETSVIAHIIGLIRKPCGAVNSSYDAAWSAILASDELKDIRDKLSIHDLRRIIRAALSAASPAPQPAAPLEPAGQHEWQWVPKMATVEMHAAAYMKNYVAADGLPRAVTARMADEIWSYMLAAAPSPAPQPSKLKPLYVKRWRTFIMVADAIKDEVRDALAAKPAPQPGWREGIETENAVAFAICIAQVCGLNLNGRRALCDDPAAPMDCRPQTTCECRDSAKAALEAIRALAPPSPAMPDGQGELTSAVLHFLSGGSRVIVGAELKDLLSGPDEARAEEREAIAKLADQIVEYQSNMLTRAERDTATPDRMKEIIASRITARIGVAHHLAAAIRQRGAQPKAGGENG